MVISDGGYVLPNTKKRIRAVALEREENVGQLVGKGREKARKYTINQWSATFSSSWSLQKYLFTSINVTI